MATVAISIGANLGDRVAHLREGVARLSKAIGIQRVSALYETAPMYRTDQPAFLNAAILAETDLGPLGLLVEIKRIEKQMGRTPRERYGPRDIDMDVVAYGVLTYSYHDGTRTVLEVPHPMTVERRFVLEPLAEIAPDLVLPGLGAVSELLKATEAQAASVRKIDDALLSVPR